MLTGISPATGAGAAVDATAVLEADPPALAAGAAAGGGGTELSREPVVAATGVCFGFATAAFAARGRCTGTAFAGAAGGVITVLAFAGAFGAAAATCRDA